MKTVIAEPRDGTTVGPALKGVFAGLLACIVVFVVLFKVASFENLKNDPMWAVYGLVITGVHLHALPAGGAVPDPSTATGYRPTVAIIVPAYNEPDIARDAGSRLAGGLSTGADPRSWSSTTSPPTTRCAGSTRCGGLPPTPEGDPGPRSIGGKRVGDGEGDRGRGQRRGLRVHRQRHPGPAPEAVGTIVQYFDEGERGRGGGPHRRGQPAAQHADPDARDAVLHRVSHLQVGRGAVCSATCCPGCFSAYRRTRRQVVPTAGWSRRSWASRDVRRPPQPDNCPAEAMAVLYAPDASPTNVPEHLKQFLHQQLRWKKSWLREIPRAARAVRRKNPVMVTMFWPVDHPAAARPTGGAAGHGGATALHRQACPTGTSAAWRDRADLRQVLSHEQAGHRWWQGIFFTLFYTLVLVLQMPYAMAIIGDSNGGTR